MITNTKNINQPNGGYSYGTYIDLTKFQFTLRKRRTEMARINLFQDVAAFYYQEKEEMERVLRSYWQDRPFSKETLDNMLFTHEDVIEKVINRKTAGIFTSQPAVRLVDDKGAVQEEETKQLNKRLDECGFWTSIKDAFNKVIYFNTVLVQTIYRENTVQFDTITGEEAAVNSKLDYYTIKDLKLARVDENGYFYFAYWSDTEHFLVDITGKSYPVQNNPDKVNPYHKLPFSILRRKRGRSFWADPNWALFYYQLSSTMGLSSEERASFFYKFPILWGINTGLADGEVLRPGDYYDFEQKDPNMPEPKINTLDFSVNWKELSDRHKDRRETIMTNQGIPPSTSSAHIRAMSGLAKTIDQLELEEGRIDYKALLKDLVEDVVRNFIMVNNYHMPTKDKVNDKLTVDAQFPEEPMHQSMQDIQLRWEMDIQFGAKTVLDYIADRLEISIEEAKIVYEQNKTLTNQFQLPTAGSSNTTQLGGNKRTSILQTILNGGQQQQQQDKTNPNTPPAEKTPAGV